MDMNDMSGVALIRRAGVTVAERAVDLADRELGLACTQQTLPPAPC
jgi:hypothetical protein